MTQGREAEVRHLASGPTPGEKPREFLEDVTVLCKGNASLVLERCREVLSRVLSHDESLWPSDREWPRLLPSWFVAECGPELTKRQAKHEMKRSRRLSREEMIREEARARWSVLSWIYWFMPEERSWWWWDAAVLEPNVLRITIEVEGSPYTAGALEWLLRASGASEVKRL